MKLALLTVLTLGCAAGVSAQYPSYPSAPPPPPGYVTTTSSFDPAQLDQLLSPIALYPDPLLGTVLPASTHPDQIAAAANLVSSNSDPSIVDQQPWDDSIKALAHYPDVLNWMAQNADWTNQLGAAVATQEPDVMQSVQRLRSNAVASGLLVNTPQQQVVVQNNVISIVPAQSGMVYVPYYDPQYVESSTPVGGATLRFGPAYALGGWALFGLDWGDRSVWIDHDRHRDNDWRRVATTPREREVWRPASNPAAWQHFSSRRDEHAGLARPAPLPAGRSRWDLRTQTPGLTPTGRMTPGFEQRFSTPPQPVNNNREFRPRTEARPIEPHAAPANNRPESHERQRPDRDRRDRRDQDDREHDQ